MKATINGIGVEYQIEGPRTGIPIVLIHGFPFSREMWTPQVEALKKDHYVITYDVRGHGSTDGGDGQYTLELFVDDLMALIDHLKITKAVPVGLSMGGYIALRALERHPDRFRAAVLCDTRSEADGNDGKIRRATQVITIKKDGMKKFTESFLQGVFYEKTVKTNPEAIALIRRIIDGTSPISIAGTLIALAARTDTTASLYDIKVPVLILVGQHDSVTPPSASHAMREKIPKAEIHVIPRAGHLSNLENPEEFTTHLLNFLHRLKRSAGR